MLARRLLWLSVTCWGLGCGMAAGQEGAYISVGGDYGVDIPTSDRLASKRAWGVAFRLPRPHGWSLAWDIGSSESTLSHSVNGTDGPIGTFRVRPLLGGVAYGWRRGRIETIAIVTAGVAFAGLDLDDGGRERFAAALATTSVAADGGPTLAVQPKLTTWVDLNRRFGVGVSAAYLYARPRVTVSGSTQETRVDVRGDTVRLSAGVVVKIF
jgi:hypothetical protein